MKLAQVMRRQVALESPSAPIDQPRTLENRIANLTDAPGRGMWLLSAFAGLAALLAGSGIYAVSAYLAEQRWQEVGIRKALGAGVGDIVALLCRRSLVAAVWGLVAGLLAAAALSKAIRSLLFGVAPLDPRVLGLAGAGVLVLTVLSGVGPALRAAWRGKLVPGYVR